MIVTRFAPSPNGSLHLGHAYSAIAAHDLARQLDGRFLLRIEDIDGPRSKPELVGDFRADLDWLGLEWEEVAPQSERLESYGSAAARLREKGLLYPCICSRSETVAAATADGPDGPVYPGTCKNRAVDLSQPHAWRLNVEVALEQVRTLFWTDELSGEQQAQPEIFGDVVLIPKELPSSYHLAVTLDDAADGVTLVTRGMDLFASSHVHRLLQALLDLPVPQWHHHALLIDNATGRKLAKSRHSPALSDLRQAGEDGRALAERLRAGQLPVGISPGDP